MGKKYGIIEDGSPEQKNLAERVNGFTNGFTNGGLTIDDLTVRLAELEEQVEVIDGILVTLMTWFEATVVVEEIMESAQKIALEALKARGLAA